MSASLYPRPVDTVQAFSYPHTPPNVDHQQKQMVSIGGMDYKDECGLRIARLRAEKGWTLRELSTKTGDVLSPTRISNYETGERLLGQHEAVILGKALGARPAYLMAVEDVQIPISQQEEALIRNWRTLAERDRMDFYRKIEMMALQSRDPANPPQIPAPTQGKVAVHKRVKR